jgi:hypothetical protein
MLRAAFRELHGARLHGFALLTTLGDRALASRLAAEALAEGARRAGQLRHPERAGAWLRRRVTRGLKRPSRPEPNREERRAALTALGVDAATFDTLATFTPLERATLVAAVIERLDPRDVEVVLQANAAAVYRQTASVRRRFIERRAAAHAATGSEADALAEPLLATRITDIAERALSWHRA